MQARWYETMIKRLQGKVTLNDIKANLAVLVNAINDTVETLNTLAGISDRDFTVGSTNIPSEKYTLTLGALNKIREAYKGLYLNKTCVEDPLNPGKIITFPNIYFNDSTFDRIDQTVLECPNKDAFDIYYDKENKELRLDNTLTSGFYPAGYNIDSENINWYANNISKSITISGNNAIVTYDCIDANYSASISINGNERIKVSPGDIISHNAWNTTDFVLQYNVIDNGTPISVLCTVFVSDMDGNQTFAYTVNGQPVTRNDFTQTEGRKFTPNSNIYIQSFSESSNTDTTLELHCSSQAYKYIYASPGTIDENCVEWTPIDWHRDEWVLNTTEDNLYVNPDKSPIIKVTPVQYAMGAVPLNENVGNMLIPDARVYGDWNDNSVTIDGVTIQRMQEGAMNKGFSYVNVWTPIWIPPGLNNKVTNFVNSKGIAYTINIGENS